MGIDLGPYEFWLIVGIVLLIIGALVTYTVTLNAGDFVSFFIPLILIGAGLFCLGISFAMWLQKAPPCISSSAGICW